ncbi:hypothetical protein BU16DRAFT_535530 [Lophium mytilinum]|uniref:Uncharacterized protein n=1 Tax=Lophium mytilinum TaxID=390894 RepID=A0A6A6R498_9PEZI|nr:hypothetical protein BU16DRAFT_535530 [Lophium mytilinum]
MSGRMMTRGVVTGNKQCTLSLSSIHTHYFPVTTTLIAHTTSTTHKYPKTVPPPSSCFNSRDPMQRTINTTMRTFILTLVAAVLGIGGVILILILASEMGGEYGVITALAALVSIFGWPFLCDEEEDEEPGLPLWYEADSQLGEKDVPGEEV